MVKTLVCHSDAIDTRYALEEIEKKSSELQESPIAILFFSDFEKNIEEISTYFSKKYPEAKVVGCSSYGEYSDKLNWQEDSLVATFFYGNNFKVESFCIEDIAVDLFEKAKQGMSHLDSVKGQKFCLLFAESLAEGVDGEEIIETVKDNLLPIPIIGGLSADRWKFEKSFQAYNGRLLQNSIVGLVFSGEIEVGFATQDGWVPEPETAVVTKAEGKTVYEIGGIKAIDYYESWLGNKEASLGEYPLYIRKEDEQDGYHRAPLLFKDREDGSIVFAGRVPERAEVSISMGNMDDVINAAGKAAELSIKKTGSKPTWSIAISCAARRNLLMTKEKLEFDKAHAVFGGESTMMGMHSYGEFFYDPSRVDGESFRNESFCILTISE